MFHYLIDSMSITLPSFHVGSSYVRTTAPTKLSSSRCELPSLYHASCGLEGTQNSTVTRARLFPAELFSVSRAANYV